MFFIKRSYLSAIRNYRKTITLFLLLFLLATISLGALLVRNAIQVTREHVLVQTPRLAVPQWDFERELNYNNGQETNPIDFEFPTDEIIRDIGNLNEVYLFEGINDFRVAINGFRGYIPEFDLALLPEGNLYLSLFELEKEHRAQSSAFDTRGVSSTMPFDLYTGLISINEGRFMKERELTNGAYVAVISTSLAEKNNVTIGSLIELTYKVPYRWEDNVAKYLDLVIPVEVIGLFDIVPQEIYYDPNGLVLQEQMRLVNQFYVPVQINTQFIDFNFEHFVTPVGERVVDFIDGAGMIDIRGFFILEDMDQWDEFAEQADDILPEFWYMTNLIDSFKYNIRHITTALNTLEWIANSSFIGVSLGAVVILALVIVLFLYDRRKELGIYLALGEKRKNIVIQILMEVSLIAIIAAFLALLSAQALSREISFFMLQTNIVSLQQQEEEPSRYLLEDIPIDLVLFNRELTIDEMSEMYEVRLSLPISILFFTAKISVVWISTFVPILYIIKLNPKKILLSY